MNSRPAEKIVAFSEGPGTQAQGPGPPLRSEATLAAVDEGNPGTYRPITRSACAHRQDPVDLGLTVAGVSELLDAARVASYGGPPRHLQLRVRELSRRFALASLLLMSVRRTDWRTPAVVAATLSCIVELGAIWHLPGTARPAKTGRWTLLLGVRTGALASLLLEVVRADQWEARPLA
jgi:hypothetical protein